MKRIVTMVLFIMLSVIAALMFEVIMFGMLVEKGIIH